MYLFEVAGSIAAVLTMFGFLPQVIKIYRTKSVRDISLLAVVQTWIGVILWMVYGVYRNDQILTGANVVSTTIFTIALILYFMYKDRP